MTKKSNEREMTPQEQQADEAHRDAHARAVADEKARTKALKERVADGTIEPGLSLDQAPSIPGLTPPRAADTTVTQAELLGGARGPEPVEHIPAPSKRSKE